MRKQPSTTVVRLARPRPAARPSATCRLDDHVAGIHQSVERDEQSPHEEYVVHVLRTWSKNIHRSELLILVARVEVLRLTARVLDEPECHPALRVEAPQP